MHPFELESFTQHSKLTSDGADNLINYRIVNTFHSACPVDIPVFVHQLAVPDYTYFLNITLTLIPEHQSSLVLYPMRMLPVQRIPVGKVQAIREEKLGDTSLY